MLLGLIYKTTYYTNPRLEMCFPIPIPSLDYILTKLKPLPDSYPCTGTKYLSCLCNIFFTRFICYNISTTPLPICKILPIIFKQISNRLQKLHFGYTSTFLIQYYSEASPWDPWLWCSWCDTFHKPIKNQQKLYKYEPPLTFICLPSSDYVDIYFYDDPIITELSSFYTIFL